MNIYVRIAGCIGFTVGAVIGWQSNSTGPALGDAVLGGLVAAVLVAGWLAGRSIRKGRQYRVAQGRHSWHWSDHR